MRDKLDPKIEAGRVVSWHGRSPVGAMYGAFIVMGPSGRRLKIIAGVGDDEIPWEHVSVSLDIKKAKYPPNWDEMCWVKDHWWSKDETVVQFHPRHEIYVNIHPHCLHLWRKLGPEPEMPPLIAV